MNRIAYSKWLHAGALGLIAVLSAAAVLTHQYAGRPAQTIALAPVIVTPASVELQAVVVTPASAEPRYAAAEGSGRIVLPAVRVGPADAERTQVADQALHGSRSESLAATVGSALTAAFHTLGSLVFESLGG